MSLIKDPANVEVRVLDDDGTFPNNALPVVVLRQIADPGRSDLAGEYERVFASNNWTGSWRNGVYSYHHYHSTTHEVLGISRGSAELQLGGPQGSVFEVEKGDVVIIPAGVAHKNIGSSSDFEVVGAYPNGRSFDMNYGKPGERPEADKNIASVPLPEADPVFGREGPLLEEWNDRRT